MPTALCANGHVVPWSNKRGTRLRDMRCPHDSCGTPLRRAAYDNPVVNEFWRKRREDEEQGRPLAPIKRL